MPWFLMYGISAIPFSHPGAGRAPEWIARLEKDYRAPLPAERDSDREIGARIMNGFGIAGVAYSTYRPDARTMYVDMPRFLAPTRIVYHADRNKVVLQDKQFRWDRFLTAMHARGGFRQELFWNDACAVTVDIVMIAILIWVATGLYMWGHIPSVRAWGFVALGGGCLCIRTAAAWDVIGRERMNGGDWE